MDTETDKLVRRLIYAWDGDLGELVALVELVGGVRKRGIAFAQERHARVADQVAAMHTMDGDPIGAKVARDIAELIRQCS
jgi:hypothetical protein